ncbi:hypothetical protein [Rubinisphaera italica]|uniref:DNA polymerase III subunit tau n=1 Tax=Rubinisphaera italica TaxID=2527969 RepID=A0A5C5XDH1_9PLAN|nr:hypothetical protein [Rubinisphaera italica]TWT60824.1 hypothetical protein Pan54_15510 [Rubinisphaera italica]
MSSEPTPREIENWFPGKWSEVIGNTVLVLKLMDFILNGTCNMMATGIGRTGKTRTLHLGIRSLLCTQRSPNLDPCGQCYACNESVDPKNSHWGGFRALSGSEYEYFAVDCENITKAELEDLKKNSRLYTEKTIVYLDEVAALRRRGLEGTLLKTIDESDATWFATAIKLKREREAKKKGWTVHLSQDILNRFALKVGTSVPHTDDLRLWIEERCLEWNLKIEEPDETIPLMMKRTNKIVGHVIKMLALAASNRNRTLTLQDVRKFNLDALD